MKFRRMAAHNENALAIAKFLEAHPEFSSDPYCTRGHVTSSPNGFLYREAR